MGHPQMSNIVASHPQATQLPGSVWVTLPVPSCLNTSAPSLRPFSRGKLSFSALLQAQPLSLPSLAFLPTAQSGIPWPKAQGRHHVTKTSQRDAWILTLLLQNAPGSHCKKSFYVLQLGHPVEPTIPIKSPLNLASLVHATGPPSPWNRCYHVSPVKTLSAARPGVSWSREADGSQRLWKPLFRVPTCLSHLNHCSQWVFEQPLLYFPKC